jgi:hypothetical protein
MEAFLTDLAVQQHVAASTQNQALSALLFLYTGVLHSWNDHSHGRRARGFNEPDALPGTGVYDLLSDLCHVATTSLEVVA